MKIRFKLEIYLLFCLGLLRRSCDRSRHCHRRPGRVLHHGGRAGVFTRQVQAGESADPRAGRSVRVAAEDVEGQDGPHDLSHSLLVIPSGSW